MSVLTVDPYQPEQGRDTALWTVSALVVAALHVGLAAAYLLLKPVPDGRAEAPAIDVAFVPAAAPPAVAAPDAPQAAPTPPVEQSALEAPQVEPQVEPVVPPDALTAPAPAPAEPQEKVELPPEPSPPLALTTPEPPRTEDAIVAPPPPPKPVEAKPEQHKPVTPHERAERKPEDKHDKPEHKTARAKPAAEASKPTRMAAAPNPGAQSEGARAGQASWNSEVVAQIRRYAAYPADGGGASGTVMVSVVIDRGGRLRSHRLAGSSGSPALDRAALAIVERAQPYPPFAPGMTEAQVTRTVPLHLRPR